MVGDGRRMGVYGLVGTARTARVMSHDFDLAGIIPEVQALGPQSPTVHPVLTLPSVVRPSTPKRRTKSSPSRPPPNTDGLDGWDH